MTDDATPDDRCTARTPTTGLDAEVRIEWIAPTAPLDYVREAYLPTSTWRSPLEPPAPDARTIGYAVHEPPRWDAPSGATARRERRVFYLRPDDRCADPGDPLPAGDPYAPPGAPAEAVDPRTVAPGESGELTERVWYGAGGDDGGETDAAVE